MRQCLTREPLGVGVLASMSADERGDLPPECVGDGIVVLAVLPGLGGTSLRLLEAADRAELAAPPSRVGRKGRGFADFGKRFAEASESFRGGMVIAGERLDLRECIFGGVAQL